MDDDEENEEREKLWAIGTAVNRTNSIVFLAVSCAEEACEPSSISREMMMALP
jgi:hypothetical protein